MQIRRLRREEWTNAFAVVRQLRDTLSESEYLCRVARQNTRGYELYGAFLDSTLIGVLGMRPVDTLARGHHFHVDDLVVTEDKRGRGTGRALLEFAELETKRQGGCGVFLDSRREALDFYERLGYVQHPSPLMRKRI